MNVLKTLNEATETFLESVKVINEKISAEIWEQAPLIIHQGLCSELVRLAKNNPSQTLEVIPEAKEIMTALDVLERLYPKLKSKT